MALDVVLDNEIEEPRVEYPSTDKLFPVEISASFPRCDCFRDGGFKTAMNHCTMARSELPARPMLPLHHGIFTIASITSYPSSDYCVPIIATLPSESPDPLASTVTIAKPRATNSAESGPSNFSSPFKDPEGITKPQGRFFSMVSPLNFLPNGLQARIAETGSVELARR